jgi:hypothetical protein
MDMGGYVRIVASDSPGTPENLSVYLHDRVAHWLRENNKTLISHAAIDVDGRTVELASFHK